MRDDQQDNIYVNGAYLLLMPSDEFGLKSFFPAIKSLYSGADPAHDFSHILRVYRNAAIIGREEGADMQILLLAALLHDVGEKKSGLAGVGRNGPGREKAESLLRQMGLLQERIGQVLYAVDVHRYSMGIIPDSLEARILQDADRLDAMGAIGIARVFMTGGTLGRRMYHPADPFCREREPDDGKWNLDHFYRKLLCLGAGMHTKSARRLASKRTDVLRRYLIDLEEEIGDLGGLCDL